MAVAKMLRLRLLGLKSDKNEIMNILVRSGNFEVKSTTVEGAKPSDRSRIDAALSKQAKVSFAIEYLSACAEEYGNIFKQKNKGKISGELALKLLDPEIAKMLASPIESVAGARKSSGRITLGYDDFYDVGAKEYELLAVCDELEKVSFNRLENKSKLTKLNSRERSLEPYEKFPLAFSSLTDGQNISLTLWYSPSSAGLPEINAPLFTECYPCVKGSLCAVICRLTDKEAVTAAYMAAGYSQCAFSDDMTPAEILRGLREEKNECRRKDVECLLNALEYYKYLSELKTLYDVLGQDLEKATAELDFVTTADTFVAEGWLPEDCADRVIDKVKKHTEKVVTELTPPAEGEEPPTLIKSKKIFKPYEDVTNMYSVPLYGEIDPNPFMAVFFFIFFGMMIGDAGYGVILTVAAVLILRFGKFEKGTNRLIALIGMGGISAIVWGILFGGVFSIESIPPLWFNPVQDPLMMLGASIVLGAVQLLFGYGLNAARAFREHRYLDGVLDNIFIFILFAALACMGLDLLLNVNAPLMLAGRILLGRALLGILCTAGRHRKGFFGKLMGGFSGLYGLVNLLSDLLSYARLFGLGLASGAIGMAFNQLGSIFFGIPVVGYVIGIIILIPLHAFNIGIGILGAYVHNARLQFLEFYGKFYEGGGRLFSPMGEKTKYVRFGR